MSTETIGRRLPPWSYTVAGTLVILATYLYLLIERPSGFQEGGHGSSAGLIALGGYLIGSVLVVSGAAFSVRDDVAAAAVEEPQMLRLSTALGLPPAITVDQFLKEIVP